MIRQITTETLHEIEHLIDEYDEAQPPNPFARDAPPLIERLKKGLEAESFRINAYSLNDSECGFSVLNMLWGSFMILYVPEGLGDEFLVKRELLDDGLDALADFSPIRIGSNVICDNLSEYAVSKGFERLNRKHMTLPRPKLLNLTKVSLPEGYYFEPYRTGQMEDIAKLVYEANIGNVDVKVFPNFFNSIEAATSLIDNIEKNVYGTFKEGHSLIILRKSKPIGVIFLTLLSPDTGCIPDICIHKEHRKQGLGRALITQSMKLMAEKESDMRMMNLDVTLANPARFLYESLGFETVRTYSIHMLFKDS